VLGLRDCDHPVMSTEKVVQHSYSTAETSTSFPFQRLVHI
jgi:hypothetical protein